MIKSVDIIWETDIKLSLELNTMLKFYHNNIVRVFSVDSIEMLMLEWRCLS